MRELKFHSEGGSITAKIRNEWGEVSTGEFIAMQGASELEVMAMLTGLTVEQLAALSEPSLAVIAGLLEDMEPVPAQDYPLDIEDFTIGQLETARAYAGNGLVGIAQVYGVYQAKAKPWSSEESEALAEAALNKPVTEVLPFALYIFRELERVATKYAGLSESDYSDDELDAGVEAFAGFGFFPTMDTLAGGDILKYDEIMQQSVRKIYAKLTYDKQVSQYQKALTEIKQYNPA